MNFTDYGFDESILKAISDLGWSDPTDVQTQSFDPVLDGYDVVVQSKTGSGKTGAFGLPLIQILKDRGQGLRALIMTPTRELAKQVCEDLQAFAKYTDLRFALVYGGVGMDPQIHAIRDADVLVGTPGRILDHLSQGTLSLSTVQFLVLDEADRMLEMGFIDDVKKIITGIPQDHITMMFSATMPDEIRVIAETLLFEPVYIKCDVFVEEAKLQQYYLNVENRFKLSTLKELIEREKPDLAIVFCGTRGLTDNVAAYLQGEQLEAQAIHGGLTQAKREQVMKGFHAGKVHVLVATDVAARGLDIDNVTHIFNYNIPKTVQEYIHRMGRTARAGKEGKVITLLGRDEHEDYSRIDSYFAGKIEKLDLGTFEPRPVTMPRRNYDDGGFGRGPSRGGRSYGRGPRDGPREPRHFGHHHSRPAGTAERADGPSSHGASRTRRRGRGPRTSSTHGQHGGGERSFYGSKN
jgi:ATP-dependent RNA helicase DeaD